MLVYHSPFKTRQNPKPKSPHFQSLSTEPAIVEYFTACWLYTLLYQTLVHFASFTNLVLPLQPNFTLCCFFLRLPTSYLFTCEVNFFSICCSHGLNHLTENKAADSGSDTINMHTGFSQTCKQCIMRFCSLTKATTR